MSDTPTLPCTVTIDALTPRGEGSIALTQVQDHPVVTAAFDRLKNKETMTVPFALPGETVSIEIKHKSRFELVGRLVKVLKPSSDRAIAPCPHFETCGGCVLQHYSEDMYRDFKRALVSRALRAHDIDTSALVDPIIIGAGQRRRIDFMARKWDGDMKMGFHEAFSKKPFNVESCPLIHPDIPKLFEGLREQLLPLLAYERMIHVFITRAQNGIDLLLAGFKAPLSGQHIASLKGFAKTHDLAKLAYKVKKKEIVIHQRSVPTVHFGEHDVPVTAFGFLQATEASDQIFGDFLKVHLPPETSLTIADLFCGRGTLSLNLTKSGHHVHGYECDGQALDALRTIDEPKLTIHARNLFETPLTAQELDHFDVIVMNPPRAGAEAQTKALASSNVKNIVYISCNADSFARDAKALIEAGFSLKTIVPVDQFMWTPHIEIMAAFEHTRL